MQFMNIAYKREIFTLIFTIHKEWKAIDLLVGVPAFSIILFFCTIYTHTKYHILFSISFSSTNLHFFFSIFGAYAYASCSCKMI